MVNILLADDDEDDRLFFQDALIATKIEHNLNMFINGVELMEFITKTPVAPAILFLDVNMPLKSGLECLFEIRNGYRIQGLEVVIFSTSGSLETISESFRFGASLYVQKPSNYDKLVSIIEFVVSNPQRRNRDDFVLDYNRLHIEV